MASSSLLFPPTSGDSAGPESPGSNHNTALLGAEQPGMQSPGSKAPKHRDTGFQEASEDPLQRQMGTYSLLRVLVICKMSTSGFWCQLQICGMQLVSGYVSLRIAKWQKTHSTSPALHVGPWVSSLSCSSEVRTLTSNSSGLCCQAFISGSPQGALGAR